MYISTQIHALEWIIVALSDYGEVVATLLLVILYFQQKRVLSRQVKLTESLERADLEVEHANITTESGPTGFTDRLHFGVENIGRSPASNLRIWPIIYLHDGDDTIDLWNKEPGIHNYQSGILEVESSDRVSNIDGPLNSYSVPPGEVRGYTSVLKIGTISVPVSYTQLFRHIQNMDIESEYVEVYLTLLYDNGVGGRGAARIIGGWAEPEELDTFEDLRDSTGLDKAAPSKDLVFQTYDKYAGYTPPFYKRPIRWLKQHKYIPWN